MNEYTETSTIRRKFSEIPPGGVLMLSREAMLLNRFNEAFNRHDPEGMMALMKDDCVFENTFPPPDGSRYQGQVAVRKFWEEFFRSSPEA